MTKPLLKPTGSFGVGIHRLELHDENRPELSHPKGRLIPVQIYFPTESQEHIPQPKIYEERAPQTFPPLEVQGYGRSQDLSQLISGKHPLVIFNPGEEVAMTDYSMILEDLASHRYVVFSLQNQLNTDTKPPSFWRDRSISKYANTLDNILYLFEWIKENKKLIFKDKIDINRIALMGHSLGGTALLILSQRLSGVFKETPDTLLPRQETGIAIKECIVVIDGQFSYPRHTEYPILFCLSEERKPYQIEVGILKDLEKVGHSFKHYKGSRHISFMDHSWVLEKVPHTTEETYFNGTQNELESFWQNLRQDIRDFLKRCGV